jgi:hypothetical protein
MLYRNVVVVGLMITTALVSKGKNYEPYIG